MWRGIVGKVLPVGVRLALKRWLVPDRPREQGIPISTGCEVLRGGVPPELLRGWQDPLAAERQDSAFAPLLREMREGRPREDFAALAGAVRLTGAVDPLIVEVGCGSAWNAEVLAHLWKRPFRYVGVDYSQAMLSLARRHDPQRLLAAGDATALPFRDKACDILLSGTVLMHVLDYRRAILESRRVARTWCIFHTVPVVEKRPTTTLKKFAYGIPVVEVVFNADEFRALLEQHGLVLREVLPNIPHEYLSEIMCEPVTARTYICAVA